MGATYAASLVSDIYRSTIFGSSVVVRSARQLQKVAKAKPSSSELSFWHSISKDLFSKVRKNTSIFSVFPFSLFFLSTSLIPINLRKYLQVFRSLRSVIFGIAAFFTSCNRHRLRYLSFLHFDYPFHSFQMLQFFYFTSFEIAVLTIT